VEDELGKVHSSGGGRAVRRLLYKYYKDGNREQGWLNEAFKMLNL
jgi:hypothetical protein